MEEKLKKNRHERRVEDAEKRRQNKRLRQEGEGYLWRKDANGEWCMTQDYDKAMELYGPRTTQQNLR